MTLRDAARDGGWLLGVAGFLLAVFLVVAGNRADAPLAKDIVGTNEDVHRTVVQTLADEPPLATAYDICLDPASKFGHYVQDGHFEGQLVQNEGQVNQVRYHLFWQPSMALDIVIEETRTGRATLLRTDPHTKQFDDCIATKTIEEIRPRQ